MRTPKISTVGIGAELPKIISPKQLATLLGLSVSTVYRWLSEGRLEGCTRRRGKHVLIVRERAIDEIFNGKVWN